MSHFSTLVLVPRDASDEAAAELLEECLARFDENLETAEHDESCGCIGLAADMDAWKAAEAAHGPIDDVRAAFWKLPDAERTDEKWREMTAARTATKDTALAAHADKDKPDPKCDDCKGSGVYRTTSNPDAKWDYWGPGGRWDGAIHGNDEATTRRSADGFNFGEEHRELRRNRRNVGDYLAACERGETHLPFAVVTPDGKWNEKGEMGWFGVVVGEKDDWKAQATAILRAHAEFDGVLCDMHI